MNLLQSRVGRRQFLKLAAAVSLAPAVGLAAEPAPDDVSFFLVGDTHYYASKETPTQLDDDSKVTNARLVDWLNKLPGSEIPAASGGGTLGTPKGVIHAGDVIDSGDKGASAVARKQQETEWAAFVADWGLKGDARLKWPAFEVHGNHDGPRGDGPVVSAIIERNKSRKEVVAVSDSGLHYAWTWNGIHFLNLGIVVGGDRSVARARRYDPKGVGSSRVDLQACKLEYSIVSPK